MKTTTAVLGLSLIFLSAVFVPGLIKKTAIDPAPETIVEPDIPKPNSFRVEPSGELSFGHFPLGYAFKKTEIPKDLLGRIEKTVLFAFEQGAAEEISEEDLYHAHLLHRPAIKSPGLNNVDGILLHSYELRNSDHKNYQKRNIFSSSDGQFSILPCSMGVAVKNMPTLLSQKYLDGVCTVYPVDLGMVAGDQITFREVDTVPESALSGYEVNIRQIRGRQVLFGLVRYLN